MKDRYRYRHRNETVNTAQRTEQASRLKLTLCETCCMYIINLCTQYANEYGNRNTLQVIVTGTHMHKKPRQLDHKICWCAVAKSTNDMISTNDIISYDTRCIKYIVYHIVKQNNTAKYKIWYMNFVEYNLGITVLLFVVLVLCYIC